MKKFVLPMLALATALAMSSIAGIASADAAQAKMVTHHQMVHHPKHKTHCRVVNHKRVCHIVHHKPVHHKSAHHARVHHKATHHKDTHHSAKKS